MMKVQSSNVCVYSCIKFSFCSGLNYDEATLAQVEKIQKEVALGPA